MFNRAIEKVAGAPSALCNGTQNHTHTHLAHLRFAKRRWPLVDRVKRCSTLLVNKPLITLNIKIHLRMCFTRTLVIKLALLPEQHSTKGACEYARARKLKPDASIETQTLTLERPQTKLVNIITIVISCSNFVQKWS